MKSSKAAGPSGALTDMLNAAGEKEQLFGPIWVTEVCNSVVNEGEIP